MPTLLLTTKGRRTGRERTTPVMYLPDGECFLVTSQNFGQARPAAWPLNLKADPVARMQVGPRTIECRARLLGRDEAERHWPRFVEAWPAHQTYLERSGVRHMFILQPVEDEQPT